MAHQQTILCTWEIGAELGHISRLSAIARALEAQGYKVVVALKDLSRAYPFFAGTRVALMQAPVWLPQITLQRPIACLADSLLLLGYLEPEPLACLVQAWQSLASLVQPDLVIFDYSPTAMLALRELPVPKILVGSGFCDPVPGEPIADWRPYATADDLVTRQEARVLGVINQMQERHGYAALPCLTELFRTDRVFITNFRELDVYPNRPQATYCLASGSIGNPQVVFARDDRPRIVAYLKPGYPHFVWLLQALAACGANVFAICPNGPVAQLKSVASERFEFTREVVDLAEALTRADLFVGHGNAGSVRESLVAGTPVLVLPIQLEQLLTGHKVQALELGWCVEHVTSAAQLTQAIEDALARAGHYRQSINKLLMPYAKPLQSVQNAVVAACAELLS